MTNSNRHPADRLADVRAAIAELREEEQELRQVLIDSDDRRGDEWVARVDTSEQERFDIAKARRDLPREVAARFQYSASFTAVRLAPRWRASVK